MIYMAGAVCGDASVWSSRAARARPEVVVWSSDRRVALLSPTGQRRAWTRLGTQASQGAGYPAEYHTAV